MRRPGLRAAAALAALAGLTGGAAPASGPAHAPADLVARWSIAGQPLRLSSRPEDAGAVSSLVFRGVEHVAGSEHGYLLQGAAQFGPGAECLNPTQAGSRTDGPGMTSSVRLEGRADARAFATLTRMAYWTPPGRTCTDAQGRRSFAWNRTALSDTLYRQRLTPGAFGRAARLHDEATFTVARTEPAASFEVVTGYLPPAFDRLEIYDARARRLRPEPGLNTYLAERGDPVVVSTADGAHAMAVLARTGEGAPRYAAFHSAAVSKWSLVYHYPQGLAAGPHRYTCDILVGARAEVLAALDALARPSPLPGLALDMGAVGAALALGGELLARMRRRRRPRLKRLG